MAKKILKDNQQFKKNSMKPVLYEGILLKTIHFTSFLLYIKSRERHSIALCGISITITFKKEEER